MRMLRGWSGMMEYRDEKLLSRLEIFISKVSLEALTTRAYSSLENFLPFLEKSTRKT